ncbi:hypothetical protein ES703_78981 [subsurface metagenome]
MYVAAEICAAAGSLGLIAADVAIDDVHIHYPKMQASATAKYGYVGVIWLNRLIDNCSIVDDFAAHYGCQAMFPEQSAALIC